MNRAILLSLLGLTAVTVRTAAAPEPGQSPHFCNPLPMMFGTPAGSLPSAVSIPGLDPLYERFFHNDTINPIRNERNDYEITCSGTVPTT